MTANELKRMEARIVARVSELTGVPMQQMMGTAPADGARAAAPMRWPNRTPEVVAARMLACKVLREVTRGGLVQIQRALRLGSVNSVYIALSKFRERAKARPELAAWRQQLLVEFGVVDLAVARHARARAGVARAAETMKARTADGIDRLPPEPRAVRCGAWPKDWPRFEDEPRADACGVKVWVRSPSICAGAVSEDAA